jgi:hypothetical protein
VTQAQHDHSSNTGIRHGDHVDYLHDGEMHHEGATGMEKHSLEVTVTNPDGCREVDAGGHSHGPDCGHEQVPHGDHTDFLVDGRLQHEHGDHTDDHGPVEVVQTAAD